MKLQYNADIAEPFAAGYLSARDKGPYAAMGEGLYAEGCMFPVEYDAEVGLFQCGRHIQGAGYVSGSGIIWRGDIMARKKEQFPEYAAFFDAAEEALGGLDTGSLIGKCFTENEHKCMANKTVWGGTWAGHTVPDFGGLLELGTAGLRAKITRYRKVHPYAADFYDGLERVLDLFETVGARVKAQAEQMAENAPSEAEKEHFLALAKVMETCPQNPPYDFLSAAQFFWLFFSYDGYDSPGRLDQIFLPYWVRTPYDEAFSILEGMWHGFHKHRTWNICISGSDENGNDTTNEISFAILELVKKHRYQTPNLTMRCHDNTDPALMRSAAEALAEGCGLPALYNDRGE